MLSITDFATLLSTTLIAVLHVINRNGEMFADAISSLRPDAQPWVVQLGYCGHRNDDHACQFGASQRVTEYEAQLYTARAAAAYRTLKLGMAAMKSRSEEGMFFTLEQRSLRHSAVAAYSQRLRRAVRTLRARSVSREEELNDQEDRAGGTESDSSPLMRLHEIALSWMYDTISEFGRNAVRPLACLVVVSALFAVAYGANSGQPLDLHAAIDLPLLKQAMLFSIEQIVRPFFVWAPNPTPAFAGDTIKLLATLQSVMSLTLLSLSLLALNWRFKRD